MSRIVKKYILLNPKTVLHVVVTKGSLTRKERAQQLSQLMNVNSTKTTVMLTPLVPTRWKDSLVNATAVYLIWMKPIRVQIVLLTLELIMGVVLHSHLMTDLITQTRSQNASPLEVITIKITTFVTVTKIILSFRMELMVGLLLNMVFQQRILIIMGVIRKLKLVHQQEHGTIGEMLKFFANKMNR